LDINREEVDALNHDVEEVIEDDDAVPLLEKTKGRGNSRNWWARRNGARGWVLPFGRGGGSRGEGRAGRFSS
jgi:hypothetical protein